MAKARATRRYVVMSRPPPEFRYARLGAAINLAETRACNAPMSVIVYDELTDKIVWRGERITRPLQLADEPPESSR